MSGFRFEIAESATVVPSRARPVGLRLQQAEEGVAIQVQDDEDEWHTILYLSNRGDLFRSIKLGRNRAALGALGLIFDIYGKIELRK